MHCEIFLITPAVYQLALYFVIYDIGCLIALSGMTSPVQFRSQYFLVISGSESIPAGSMIINPQTGTQKLLQKQLHNILKSLPFP